MKHSKKMVSFILAVLVMVVSIPVALAQDDDAVIGSIEVTIDKPTINVSQTAQLSIELLTKLNAPYTGDSNIVYTSINPNVGTVDQNGLITAHNYGMTKIIVTAQGPLNMVSKTVSVTVLRTVTQPEAAITFEDMNPDLSPPNTGGIIGSSLVTVTNAMGKDSTQSAYLNDDSISVAAFLNYRMQETASTTLTLDFDVYFVEGHVQFKILNNGHSNGNTAFWIRLTSSAAGYYSGSGWQSSLIDRDASVNIKASNWNHVHVEINNTSVNEGTADIYIDGKFAGTAAKSYSASYGINTGLVNSVYFTSQGVSATADRLYIDNIYLRPGIEPLTPEVEDQPITIDIGERIEFVKNTEEMRDENGDLILGNEAEPDYIAKYYEDGFGFAHLPVNTFSSKSNDYSQVFVPYYQHRDVRIDNSIDSVKIFDTSKVLDVAENGGDIHDLYYSIKTEENFMCNFVELPDGRFFATSYLSYPINSTSASTICWIFDPADETWTKIPGTMRIPKLIPGITGFAPLFTKAGILDDGTLISTAYGGGACYMLQTEDFGVNWTVRSVIYGPEEKDKYSNPDGTPISVFYEPSLQRCPDGTMLTLLRVGNNLPLWQKRSRDDGLTWSQAEVMPGAGGAGSIYPCTTLLDNGVLVASTGRPNTTVLFSLDGCGYKWDYITTVYDDAFERTNGGYNCSGNASVAQIGENLALVTGDYGFAEDRPAGVWGHVIEVTRNERTQEIDSAILKAPSDRLVLGQTFDLYTNGIFDNNGRLLTKEECDIRYYSESPEILGVNETTGEVSTVTFGTANVIAAISFEGKTILTNTVEITAVDTERVSLVSLNPEDWTLNVGQSIDANVTVANMIDEPLTEGINLSYSSSNTEIATVNDDGIVTGVAPGIAEIIATAVKDGVAVSGKTLIVVNSPLWEVSDFENGTVGEDLTTQTDTAYTIVVPSPTQKPQFTDTQAYSGSQSLYFKDVGVSDTPAIRREYSSRQAVIVEFMIYPIAAPNGLAFGIGKAGTTGHTSNSICWIQLRNPTVDETNMDMRAYHGSWTTIKECGVILGQWNKIRLEAVADKQAKIIINDQFVYEIPVLKVMDDLGNFCFYNGVNVNDINNPEECYLDDLKVMTFDLDAGEDLSLSDLTFEGTTIEGFSPNKLVYDIALIDDGEFAGTPANQENNVEVRRVNDDQVQVVVRSSALEQVYLVNITWLPKPAIPAIEITGISNGNIQSSVYFPIISANGKGYEVYISETGEQSTFAKYEDVNYSANGVHIKKLTNGNTYYIYIVYMTDGEVSMISDVVVITPK